MSAPPRWPEDDTGEMLRCMAAAGVDLTVERAISFAHLARDEAAARAFARDAADAGFAVAVHAPTADPLEERDTEWSVLSTRTMVPTHAAITAAEGRLAALARRHGCQEDGWSLRVR